MGMSIVEFELQVSPYIRKNVLPLIPGDLSQLNTELIGHLRSRLHALGHCCGHCGIYSDTREYISDMLEISLCLWELLQDNAEAIADVKDVSSVRKLVLGANILGHMEEIISGEESPRDILINAIATFLNWKSDSLWVKMAKVDHRMVVKSHIMRLQDIIWKYINKEASDRMDLDGATFVSTKVQELLSAVTSDKLPVLLRIVIVSQVYVSLLQLYTHQILTTRESMYCTGDDF